MDSHSTPLSTGAAAPSPGVSRRRLLTAAAGAFAGAQALFQGSASSAESSVSDTAPKSLFDLHGKSAFVTGAARGIGRAIALALAHAGADIIGLDKCGPVSPEVIYPPASRDELDETGRLVQEQKRRFLGITADIRELADLRAAVEQAEKTFGQVDIFVANAGIQVYSPLAEMHDAQWRDVIDTNLTGSANCLRAIIPPMIKRKGGRIILIASGQGRHGMRDGAAYSASKWGIIGLMKSAALELGEYGITVNTVEPGLVDTPMTRNIGRWNEALQEAGLPPKGDQVKEEDVIAARVPRSVMKIPWMQPSEVAPAVVFLASDAASRVTGATYDATAGDSAKYTA